MFIKGRIAVTADGVSDEKDLTPETNTIFIRPKMDFGTRQKVVGAAAKVQVQRGKRGKATAPIEMDVGAYQIALLTHNVLAWQGKDFAGVACTPANIQMLDMDEPLVQRVLQEISDRNVQKAEPEPADDGAEGDDPNVVTLPASLSAGS